MTLIDKALPSWRLRQIDRVAVGAEPQEAWLIARGADLGRLPVSRFLFGLRMLPERVLSRLRGKPLPAQPTSHIEDFAGPGRDWLVLAEEPDREVVVGAIGRFWQARIDWAKTAPAEFPEFAQPGFGKVAWCIRVDPRVEGGAWITFELRVTATDDGAWRKFEPYWRLIGRFSHLLRHSFLREMRKQLGAPGVHDPLPGDALLDDVRYQRTHRAVIEAPPAKVWPWLAQMGCRRAGWYAIDRLDNGGVRSADRVIDELQHIAPGDLLPATPDDPGGFAVLRVDPPRALVLGSPDLLPGAKPSGFPYKMTWAFALEPIGDDATNLVVRVRSDVRRKVRFAPVVAAHEIMQRSQLRNLKARIEA